MSSERLAGSGTVVLDVSVITGVGNPGMATVQLVPV
jgi:hypothetical protein